jgi:predicted NAD/FAD-binding protein
LALPGCEWWHANATLTEGGFTGASPERGHRLREKTPSGLPARTRSVHTLILGGGVAGLAAARALRQRGHEDFALLELEDRTGGNARAGTLGGMPHPLGAHYLPVPGDDTPEVQDLLEELGLRSRLAGRWVYDERHLCHSPQERLLFQGQWQDGLLPLQGVGTDTLAQYQRFATLVAQAQKRSHWAIPVQKSRLAPEDIALTAITFIAYLERNGLTDSHLRWYLDYCCRDDYGAGIATVSAWAGVHYFASRHGFHAPGTDGGEREAVLTWPEGNAWLTQRLAAPLGERQHTGRVVLRVAEERHGVSVEAWDCATQQLERWQARQAVLALPLHVAVRVLEGPPNFLRQAAAALVHAPWLVANLQLDAPLRDRAGAAPSWDNVLYGTQGLGYVDAMHQNLQSHPGATVLTHYRTPMSEVRGQTPHQAAQQARTHLLQAPWTHWRDTVLAELAQAHPDLPAKVRHLEVTRYGHAMACPVPGFASQIGLQPAWNVRKQLPKTERLAFAHSDWSGYSVFEEAFVRGHTAAQAVTLRS